MTPVEGIRIFRINHTDWWAGTDIDSCITAAIEELGLTRDDVIDDTARELSDNEADTLKFVEGDDPVPPDFTFRQALQHCISRGDQFPQAFASTEW